MALIAFNIGRGDRQLRVVEPEGFEQTDNAAYVLGSSESGWYGDIGTGDGRGVYRTDFDFTDVNWLEVRIRMRGPEVDPPGHYWALGFLINDVLKMVIPLQPGRILDLTDVAINVSKLTGLNKAEFRLRMVAA